MLKKLNLNGSIKTYKTFLELTPKTYVLFIIGDWNAKVGGQEHVDSQVWPWSTKGSMTNANRALLGQYTGHSKHLLPTIQEMTLHMDMTRWSIPKAD